MNENNANPRQTAPQGVVPLLFASNKAWVSRVEVQIQQNLSQAATQK